jgi:hypothetical protein
MLRTATDARIARSVYDHVIPVVSWRLFFLLVAHCGYHAVYGEGAEEKLHVRLSRAPVADAAAADEVVSGAREQLAREGALASGDGFPRLEIEVVRIDETSAGVLSDGTQPHASGTWRAVVARAWIVEREGADRTRDTGDVQTEDLAAVQGTAVADQLAATDGARALARRLGRRIALRVLGHPTSSDGLGRQPAPLPQP